jgi:hypothetical protein
MIDCLPNADNTACVNCGWKKPEKITGWPHRNCPQSTDLQPAAKRLGVSLSDVSHYAQALARWTVAGFPVRDQTEVERIERELCRPCEKYVEGRCKTCGCRVTSSSLAVANKIKMATESCPAGKW